MGKRKEPKDAAISDHGSGAMTYDPRVSNLFMSSVSTELGFEQLIRDPNVE